MSNFDDMLKGKKSHPDSSGLPQSQPTAGTPAQPPPINHQQVVADAVAQIKREEELRKGQAHGCGCGTSILAIIGGVIWLAYSETGNAFGVFALLAAGQENSDADVRDALIWMIARLTFVVGLFGYLIGRFGFARIWK